jgi:hypothetical protein
MARINAEIMAGMEAAERAGSTNPREATSSPSHCVQSSSTSIHSTKSEDPEDVRAREEMARINAEIMAAAAAAEKKPRTSAPPLPPKLLRRQTLADDEAREEIARLNAKILADLAEKEAVAVEVTQLPSFTPHQHLPTWANQADLPVVNGSHGVLKFGADGADMGVVETPKVEEVQHPKGTASSTAPFVYREKEVYNTTSYLKNQIP